MEYLHTMVRVTDLAASLDFYCNKFGLVEAPQPRRVTAEVRAPFERPHRDENRRHRRYEDDDVPVVGLGDHVPSFLLRPVRLKPLKPGKELAAAED